MTKIQNSPHSVEWRWPSSALAYCFNMSIRTHSSSVTEHHDRSARFTDQGQTHCLYIQEKQHISPTHNSNRPLGLWAWAHASAPQDSLCVLPSFHNSFTIFILPVTPFSLSETRKSKILLRILL